MHRLSAILVLGIAACTHTQAGVTDVAPKFPPICTDGVKVFADPSAVGQPYVEVAVLSLAFESESGYTSQNKVSILELKRAAQVGANGLVVGDVPARASVTSMSSRTSEIRAPERKQALAIYIPGDSSRVRTACNGTSNRH